MLSNFYKLRISTQLWKVLVCFVLDYTMFSEKHEKFYDKAFSSDSDEKLTTQTVIRYSWNFGKS